MSKSEDVSKKQEDYYGSLFQKHGAGVDAVASGEQVYKDLRYEKLSAVFADDRDFSIHDVGFGLGHYYEYMKHTRPGLAFTYSGSEVTRSFVDHCQKAYPDLSFFHRDLAKKAFEEKYDYLIFGGTFYHKVDTPDADFEEFIFSILQNAFAMARKGISFNFITDFVDYRYEDLYYAKIAAISKFVRHNLSRFFTIDHSSPLFEFTVSVYTEDHISEKYPDKAFHKYFKARKN